MPAVALTDHGSLAGAVELYREAGKQGVKPVLGCEVYVADDRRAQQKGYAHLTLLAETNEGYANLIKLSSRRLPGGLLLQAARRLGAARSGTPTGSSRSPAASRAASARRSRRAGRTTRRPSSTGSTQIFGRDDVYVEMQNAGLDIQARINPLLAGMAEQRGLPLVATGDVHYLLAEDARAHEALLCIQSGDSLQQPEPLEVRHGRVLLQDARRDGARLPRPRGRRCGGRSRSPSAATSTMELGRVLLPKFPTPEGRDAFDYLVELCEQGLERRYDRVTPELTERLQFELKTIKEMGFADYFLIVWDFIHFAKGNGVSVGPGRGSAAGSLAAYALDITDVDPMRYGLLFERFLNPARKDLPDMDIDFSVAGRDRVINYVSEKYGRDRVAQIITFGTMAARAAVRDAGRVLEIPYGSVDKIAKLIPEGPGQTLDECLKPGAELRQSYDSDPLTKEIVDLAKPLEGLVRQDSIHAAGVVIGAQPLTEVVPLQQKGADQEIVTQIGMCDVVELGLLKMDFLGLRNLDVIDAAVELIGGGLDIETLPLDDALTYRDARRRRLGRRLPVRVVGDARRAAPGEADRVRGPDRPRRALPAGPDAVHPGVREAQERPGAGHVHRRAAQGDHRRLVRDLHLPGAVHADRQGDRRLLAGRGGDAAQGDRQEDPRADGVAQGQVPRGRGRRPGRRPAWRSSSGRTWSRRRTTPSTRRTRPATR